MFPEYLNFEIKLYRCDGSILNLCFDCMSLTEMESLYQGLLDDDLGYKLKSTGFSLTQPTGEILSDYFDEVFSDHL